MSEKKVGILTFHRASNYGAVLQAYALQQYLKKGNIYNEIIDYRCSHIEKVYSENFMVSGKSPISMVKKNIKKWVNIKKNKKFIEFRRNYLNISKNTYNLENKFDMKKVYDVFIVGSDQVWNLNQTGKDTTYFLDFVDKGKWSYAASLGKNSITNEEKEIFKDMINSFEKVSIREEENIDIIKSVGFKKQINVNVDPVFLLNKNEWVSLIEKEEKRKEKKEKYVLIYTVKQPVHLIEKAKKYAQEHNCKVIYLHSDFNYKEFFKNQNIKNVFVKSPIEFLKLILDAECVFTTSFHGTAFSILFEKEFWAEVDKDGKLNNRIFNLLQKLNIEDRILDYNPKTLDSKINWKVVRENVLKEREKSKKYLFDE
ncbi:polysaccharide pyruvyl transferase family protein [Clostridium isatidis]|uniref:polysaccharide pyruvyl transferase family protein n=1 Tax=Clostridium isatidis TaxID=182773 RepID=UPI003AB0BA32